MIRSLSDRLVEAQRPIRILDADQMGRRDRAGFLRRRLPELPPVTRDYYLSRPLPFDPEQKRQEFLDIETRHPPTAGQVQRCRPDHDAHVRANIAKSSICSKTAALPLSPPSPSDSTAVSADSFHAGDPTLADLGHMLAGSLDNLSRRRLAGRRRSRMLECGEAMLVLSERLSAFFNNPSAVHIRLSDGIVADAAAGSDYIKLRHDARFSLREIRLLEVHEGWVHLATTLNGLHQPICTFLSKGTPSSTLTQEGLAVLTEILSFSSHPGRVRRLAHRIEGVALAESGADFLDVYRFFLDQRHSPRESYQHTMRIFRGSLPSGCGPFTKDLCYCKGFVLLYNFMRLAVSRGMMHRLPLLFCGKTNLDDIKTLALLAEEGLLAPPRISRPPSPTCTPSLPGSATPISLLSSPTSALRMITPTFSNHGRD